MPPDLIDILFGALWPPCWATCMHFAAPYLGARRGTARFWERWFSAALGIILVGLFAGVGEALIGIASAVFAAVMWWLNRRQWKRAAKLIGAKSRALLAAVVARMKQAGRPRPVLRPVPGGAS